jgi:hypothetical protein
MATRLLSPGERLVNEYVLTVPPTPCRRSWR